MERLFRHVDAYATWKAELDTQLGRYRDWLQRNRLASPALDAALANCQSELQTDGITSQAAIARAFADRMVPKPRGSGVWTHTAAARPGAARAAP